MSRSVGTYDVDKLLAVVLQFRGAHTSHLSELLNRSRVHLCHMPERRVPEDNVRRQITLISQLFSKGPQLFE